MTDEQLSKLSSLVGLFVTCAQHGGTAPLVRVQTIVADDLNALLTEIEEEKEKENVT